MFREDVAVGKGMTRKAGDTGYERASGAKGGLDTHAWFLPSPKLQRPDADVPDAIRGQRRRQAWGKKGETGCERNPGPVVNGDEA